MAFAKNIGKKIYMARGRGGINIVVPRLNTYTCF
jgi:hypothetical protein